MIAEYNKGMKNILGWLGVACILIAFILTTFNVITPTDVAYGILNALGAAGIIVSSSMKKDYQPVVLNTVWLIVALIGLIRAMFSF